jgi:hypothetical protein
VLAISVPADFGAGAPARLTAAASSQRIWYVHAEDHADPTMSFSKRSPLSRSSQAAARSSPRMSWMVVVGYRRWPSGDYPASLESWATGPTQPEVPARLFGTRLHGARSASVRTRPTSVAAPRPARTSNHARCVPAGLPTVASTGRAALDPAPPRGIPRPRRCRVRCSAGTRPPWRHKVNFAQAPRGVPPHLEERPDRWEPCAICQLGPPRVIRCQRPTERPSVVE